MKHLLITASLIAATASTCAAQGIGTWKNYLAYSEITDVQQAGNTLFVLASECLYSYNTADQSVSTYDKTNIMSGCGISMIGWCAQAGRLVTVYSDGNIDLISREGTSLNMPDYYNFSTTLDKTVNGLDIYGSHAYLSTGFGVVDINVADAEVTDTYTLGFSVNYVYATADSLYAASASDGIYAASRRDNMLDPDNWRYTAPYTPRQKTIDPELLAEARKAATGGPKYNHFYYMTHRNNRLYTCGGFFLPGYNDEHLPGMVQTWDGDEWTVYQDSLQTITGYNYQSINSIAVDPADPDHVFAAGKNGLYEFQDARLVKYYNEDNSPLQSVYDRGNFLGPNYLLVNGLMFDDATGHLWMLNSETQSTSIFEMTDSGFVSHHDSRLMDSRGFSYAGMMGLFKDSRGLFWFINNNSGDIAAICYQPETGGLTRYRGTFQNQNGTRLQILYMRCITEDLDGNIWLGTNLGPLYITPQQIAEEDPDPCVLTQYVVPRNDGTNYGDYLLSGVDVSAIAIDGAGRKWIGTNGNGVYLISRDNNTQLQHFTSEDTPLLSDVIESIAVDDNTGEVFIGTDMGLCSYLADATAPADDMTKDNVYAYPNPVRPGYTGLITVNGLTMDADVKITTSNGTIVASGRSQGGTFTWDGCDQSGRRVASGVYMVQTAKSDGSKGTVCKIAVVN